MSRHQKQKRPWRNWDDLSTTEKLRLQWRWRDDPNYFVQHTKAAYILACHHIRPFYFSDYDLTFPASRHIASRQHKLFELKTNYAEELALRRRRLVGNAILVPGLDPIEAVWQPSNGERIVAREVVRLNAQLGQHLYPNRFNGIILAACQHEAPAPYSLWQVAYTHGGRCILAFAVTFANTFGKLNMVIHKNPDTALTRARALRLLYSAHTFQEKDYNPYVTWRGGRWQ